MNNKKWKLFLLRDIFVLSKGERLKKYDRKAGDILLKTAGEKNNGFKEKIIKNKTFFNGNCLTIDMFGNVFFEKNGFFADDNVHILSNPNLNSLIGLFLVSILKISVKNYSYSRQVRITRLNNEKIYLPIDENEIPDWKFMEDYIKEKAKKIIYNSKNNKKEYSFNLSQQNWKYFHINEIFDLTRGKRLKSIERIQGLLNYYSASSKNNGLTDKISNPLFKDKKAILFTTFGDSYYVSEEFTVSDEITILKIKNIEINYYIGIFLVGILNTLKSKFSFGRKCFTNRLFNEKIYLPIDENEIPDWKFMEDYIKEKAKNIIL